jgi:uncharacterized protein YyaL (SSP411 family)
VTKEGNWEDQNILNRPKTLDQCAKLLQVDVSMLQQSLAVSRAKLFDARSRRVSPGRDDKILVSWNALMIDAMARGYQVLGDERYLVAARSAAEFILSKMRPASAPQPLNPSTLLHSYKDGRARFNAYLDDYASLINGLVTLYESDFQPRWLAAALELADVMIEQFWDEPGGSFYFTGRDHEQLVARVRDAHDSATPSGNSLAVTSLLRLGKLTGRNDLLDKAERTLGSFATLMDQHSRATGQMLVALDFMLNRPCEIVVIPGDSTADLQDADAAIRSIRTCFLPNKVVAAPPFDRKDLPAATQTPLHQLVPLLADKKSIDGKLTVYFCENFSCQAPAVGREAVIESLRQR